MASLMPLGKQQYFSASGAPLVGGKVYTYAAGTTTPLATYSDKAGTTPNTNPVILDSRGEATIFWGSAGYKVVLKDATDVTVWTQDNLYGSADQGDLLAYETAVAASGGSALVGFLQSGTGAVATTVQTKLRESVSVKDFGAVGDGVTDDTAAIQAALQSGAKRVYVPQGTYSIVTSVSATLPNDVELYGEGSFVYSGGSSTGNLFVIQCAGYSFSMLGLTLDGNNLIAGGPRIENQAAMSSNTLPSCYFERNTLIDFRMNAASAYNDGALIRGSFERVVVRDNNVRNITRAAGTGTPGSSGTSGISVTQYDSSKFVRECIHTGNAYSNISSDDLLASANNVDHDAFKFFAPDPTTSSGQYPESVLFSSGNTYRNCRGRALKVQATGSASSETIIRDDGYTNYGGSAEINFQWGVGTVSNCTFIYRPYDAGATSPIQSLLTLVEFYQGSDYGEDTGSAIVNGIQVLNSISAGIGSKITSIIGAKIGAGVATPSKPLVSLSNVSINKNEINWIAQIGYEATTYGTLRLDNVVIPGLTYSAVSTNGVDTNFDIVATNVMNIDGVSTPANAKPFVTNGSGASVSFGGMISGGLNQGFLQTFNVGADFNKAPMLNGCALSDPYGNFGGAASVQSINVANDASYTFDRRFFTSSRGLVVVSVNYDYTTQGMFACGSNQVHQIAAHASDLFSPSTTGANLDTAGQLNLWFTGGSLNIKNRLGATYYVTVLFLG